ncbi:hypothetical protein FD733_03685 [Pantoea sp. Eser]|nr:hypothetical protein [Pantoea sp. Eser]
MLTPFDQLEVMRRDPSGPDASCLKKAVFSLTANGQKIQPNATGQPAMTYCGAHAVGALIFRPRKPLIQVTALNHLSALINNKQLPCCCRILRLILPGLCFIHFHSAEAV